MSIIRPKKRNRRTPSVSQQQTRQRYNDYYKSQTNDTMAHVVRGESTKRKPLVNRRQATMHAKRIPLYMASMAILAALLFASLLQTTPAIVIEEDKSLYNKQHYIDAGTDILQRSVFNRSKLSFDSVAFKNTMLAEHAELQDVNVAIPLTGRKLTVGLSFIPAAFLFSASNSSQVVVGANGVVQAKASDIDSAKLANLLPITDSAPIKTEVGSAVLLPSDVSFITSVVTEMKSANIEVESIALPLGAGEAHIIPKGSTYKIKFSLSGDAKQQTGAFLTVLAQPDIIQPQTQYIDVRLADRVFVL